MQFLKFIVLAATIVFMSNATAWEPDNKQPIQIVSAYAPGGTNYLVGLLLTNFLRERGITSVITVKPGAGGSIATSYFNTLPADGKSLMLSVGLGMMVIDKNINKTTTFTIKDVEPITIIGKTPLTLVTLPENPTKTMAQFSKATKEKINIGCSSDVQELFIKKLAATMPHLDITAIKYKNTGDLIRDLFGGSLAYAITTYTSTGQFVETGKLAALATTEIGAKTPEFDPSVNIFGRGFGAIVGIVAPKNTPPDIMNYYTLLMKEFITTNKVKLNEIHMKLEKHEFGPDAFKQEMQFLDKQVNE